MSSFNEKVSRMFGDRFGTQLVIKWSDTIRTKQENLKDWQTTFVYSRTRRQVSFPIFNSKNQLQAIAIAGPVNNEDAIRFKEMSQFLQLTVTERLKTKERLDLVLKKEEVFKKSHNDDSNVIRWPSKVGKASLFPSNLSEKKPKTPASFCPLWIYGNDHNAGLKVAFAAHEWIRNWAFINVKEIPDLFWQKTDSWHSYAQMTILVPEAENLTKEQWEILSHNVRAASNKVGPKPLIIVTSLHPPESLKPDLASLFKVYKTNPDLTPKAQAHFLLFQKSETTRGWTYHCQQLERLGFLPFGTTSDLLH